MVAYTKFDQVPEPLDAVAVASSGPAIVGELVDQATVESAEPAAGADDEALARRLLGVHVPQEWPAGLFCGNCRQRHPCQMHRWARGVLHAMGWGESALDALDPRTGAWS